MGSKQDSLWQSRNMDHNLIYTGPIWVIQKPKINFNDSYLIYMKNTSPNSLFFRNRKFVPKSRQCIGSKQGSMWQSQQMDHNLSYRGPIWVIQKHNIKFTIAAKIYINDTSENSIFFPIENQSQNLDTNSQQPKL